MATFIFETFMKTENNCIHNSKRHAYESKHIYNILALRIMYVDSIASLKYVKTKQKYEIFRQKANNLWTIWQARQRI